MITGRTRNSDPTTSQESASHDFTSVYLTVNDAIKKSAEEGMTWSELELATGIPRQTISPRFVQLRHAELIRESGRKRKGPSGRNQIVWVSTTPDEMAEIRKNNLQDRREKARKILLRSFKQVSVLGVVALIEGWTDEDNIILGIDQLVFQCGGKV
jgi:hypothetical protein